MSCQPGAPVVSVLGEVGGFKVNESVQILKSKTADDIFYISGTCNASISDVEISFDNGVTYRSLSTYAASSTNNCSTTGTFSYKIDTENVNDFDIPAAAAYIDLKIRGTGDYGLSAVHDLRRMVQSNFQVTAGSYTITQSIAGTSYTIRGHLISSAASSNSGNYQFKGRVRIK